MAINRRPGDAYGLTPKTIRPGVMYRETDFIGNADIEQGPSSVERAFKGDLGNEVIPGFEPRALTSPGVPFTLRPGKGAK